MYQIIFLVLLYNFSFIDARQFRYDYKYYGEAEGFLKLHQVPATWNEARLRCHYEGAVLASPLNDGLLKAMNNVVNKTDRAQPCGIFTGIHATFSKGDYFSIEGVPLQKISVAWAPDEPDNFEDNENCLIMFDNGTLADVKCTEVFPYICYKKKTDMVITGCGTVDNQYNLDARTGSCYKMHTTGQTWARAFMVCSAEGGHLAIINNDVEAQVVKEIFAKHPPNTISSKYKDSAAIGFHDWGEHGTWLTIHGENLQSAGYAKWSGGQPDNATQNGQGEFCGAIFRTGLLDDIWCNTNLAFICEKLPGSLVADEEFE